MNRYIEHSWGQIVQHIPRAQDSSLSLKNMDGTDTGIPTYNTGLMMLWTAAVSLGSYCYDDNPHTFLFRLSSLDSRKAPNPGVCFSIIQLGERIQLPSMQSICFPCLGFQNLMREIEIRRTTIFQDMSKTRAETSFGISSLLQHA
jgi:hypothetical protein